MTRKQPFKLIYRKGFRANLAKTEAKYHSLIRDTIEEQLSFQPDVATRNRKPLREEGIAGADWELRFGPDNRFRVF